MAALGRWCSATALNWDETSMNQTSGVEGIGRERGRGRGGLFVAAHESFCYYIFDVQDSPHGSHLLLTRGFLIENIATNFSACLFRLTRGEHKKTIFLVAGAEECGIYGLIQKTISTFTMRW